LLYLLSFTYNAITFKKVYLDTQWLDFNDL